MAGITPPGVAVEIDVNRQKAGQGRPRRHTRRQPSASSSRAFSHIVLVASGARDLRHRRDGA